MKKFVGAAFAALAVLLSACTTGYLPEQFPIMHTTAVIIGDPDGGHGSGTVIAGNLVLTAAHVAEHGDADIHFIDGTTRHARTIWTSKTEDAAVMQFDGEPVRRAAEIDCRPVEWGEPFAWIGAPSVLKWNMRMGYVSSPEPVTFEGSFGTVYAVAAMFNPGDSGSGLLSADGKVRGLVHALMITNLSTMFDQSYSQSGNGLMVPTSAFCAELVAGLGASVFPTQADRGQDGEEDRR